MLFWTALGPLFTQAGYIMRVAKPVVAIFFVLALSLVGMNFALVKKNRSLRNLNRVYETNRHLSVGQRVPSLSGTDLTGTSVTLSYVSGAPKTLLLIFARSCPACDLNWAGWQNILRRLGTANVRSVGISLENRGLTTQYLRETGMNKAEALILPDGASVLSYKFQLTPQTILVGSDSRVEGIWSGVLEQKQLDEIEEALSPRHPE